MPLHLSNIYDDECGAGCSKVDRGSLNTFFIASILIRITFARLRSCNLFSNHVSFHCQFPICVRSIASAVNLVCSAQEKFQKEDFFGFMQMCIGGRWKDISTALEKSPPQPCTQGRRLESVIKGNRPILQYFVGLFVIRFITIT